MAAALSTAPIPDGTLVFAPRDCLAAMQRIILPKIRGGGGLEPYLDMVRIQWQWLRSGDRRASASDMAALEADLQAYRRQIAADMPAAELWVGGFEVEPYVEEASNHSLQRIRMLMAKEGIR